MRRILFVLASVLVMAGVLPLHAAPPSAPQGLTAATSFNNYNPPQHAVYLEWHHVNGPQAPESMEIYLSSGGGAFSSVATIPVADSARRDSLGRDRYVLVQLPPGQHAIYVVAHNADGTSPPSNTVNLDLQAFVIQFPRPEPYDSVFEVNAFSTLTFHATATDNSPVRYFLDIPPGTLPAADQISLDSITGLFSWTPTQRGTYVVKVKVIGVNDHRATAAASFWFEVVDPLEIVMRGPFDITTDTGVVNTVTINARPKLPRASLSIRYAIDSVKGPGSSLDIAIDATTGVLQAVGHTYGEGYTVQVGAYVNGETTPRARWIFPVYVGLPLIGVQGQLMDIDSTRAGLLDGVVTMFARVNVNGLETYQPVDTIVTQNGAFNFGQVWHRTYIFHAVPNDTSYVAGYFRVYGSFSRRVATPMWDSASRISSTDFLAFSLGRTSDTGGVNRLRGGVVGRGVARLKDDRSMESVPPLAGATVFALDAGGAVRDWAVTDDAGRFELGRMGVGTYTIVLDHPRYQASRSSVTFAADDGSTQELNIEPVPVGGVSSVTVERSEVRVARTWPQPARDVVNVEFQAVTGDATLNLVAADGRVVRSETLRLVDGPALVRLPVEAVPPGLYMLRVGMKGATASAPILVQP